MLAPRFNLPGIGGFVEKEADDDDDAGAGDKTRALHGPHAPAPLLIVIAIVLMLIGLGAYFINRNSGPQPLCADQPDWNQYNCKR